MFRSGTSGDSLPGSLAQQTSEVPPQLPPGVTEEAMAQMAADQDKTTKALMIVQIVAQFFLKSSLDSLWGLFFSLQIICYL